MHVDGKFYAALSNLSPGMPRGVVCSVDAQEWTTTTADSGWLHNLYGLGYGDDLFVAVGKLHLYTSPNGTAWTNRTESLSGLLRGYQDFELLDITHAQGKFVVVGSVCSDGTYGNAVILTSEDGVTWAERIILGKGALGGVGYLNGRFVACGQMVLTSADGYQWDEVSLPVASGIFGRPAFGSGRYVIVAEQPPRILVSGDLINWIDRTPAEGLAGMSGLQSVAFSSGAFVTVGYSFDNVSPVFHSIDGLDWKFLQTGVRNTLNGSLSVEGTWYVYGDSGLIYPPAALN